MGGLWAAGESRDCELSLCLWSLGRGEDCCFGRLGCLCASDLGGCGAEQTGQSLQVALGFVIASVPAQSQGAGCPRHHGVPRGTSGQRESALKCQEAGETAYLTKTFTSRKVWRRTLPDLQPDTSAGWAGLLCRWRLGCQHALPTMCTGCEETAGPELPI